MGFSGPGLRQGFSELLRPAGGDRQPLVGQAALLLIVDVIKLSQVELRSGEYVRG